MLTSPLPPSKGGDVMVSIHENFFFGEPSPLYIELKYKFNFCLTY